MRAVENRKEGPNRGFNCAGSLRNQKYGTACFAAAIVQLGSISSSDTTSPIRVPISQSPSGVRCPAHTPASSFCKPNSFLSNSSMQKQLGTSASAAFRREAFTASTFLPCQTTGLAITGKLGLCRSSRSFVIKCLKFDR